ncbi:MAG: tRNA uridine-5-carboxymethylaminomethyl(34) synthesis GTPase MnmE [Acholeplasmataceae bacterium]
MNTDTIAAISTAYGTAGISVIRVSGPEAITKINQIFKGKDLTGVSSHTIHYGHLRDKKNTIIDEVMVSVLRAPKSFTTEDMVEISTHGGILITQKALEVILDQGIRLANPGEFSERAYLNGRIDLVEADSIMDLIHAKNEKAIEVANLGIQKHTSQLIKDLRSKLLTLIAKIEVNIDYPEYDEAEVMTKEIIKPEVEDLLKEMEIILKESYKTQLITQGVKTAIIGRPNVGKSSLLNALLNEEKAIVTDIAGTTRDLVEATIHIGGIMLNLMDTAGIRTTDDFVEKIGVERSVKALNEAELVLLVLDQSDELTDEDFKLIEMTKHKSRIIIGNKSDLPTRLKLEHVLPVSSRYKKGLKDLEKEIFKILSLEDLEKRNYHYLANARHIQKVKEAKQALSAVLASIEQAMSVDILAIDLNRSWQLLGEILGEYFQEDLLNELFSKFCLGK